MSALDISHKGPLDITWPPDGLPGGNYYSVKEAGAVGNGTIDDGAAIQAAIDAVSAAGGGVVLLPKGTYPVSSPIVPKSNITLMGQGSVSIIKSTTSGNAIDNGSTAFHDFTLDSITITGPVSNTVSVPTRARTTSGDGTIRGVNITGSLDPITTYPVVTNFTMRNCIVKNCNGLPILIDGVSGVVRVINNEFTNNQDVGFIYCEEVIFSGNHIKMSADNGVSVSRKNIKVTVTNNTFENCCYNGIWLAGFDILSNGSLLQTGPIDFTCCGNTIKNVGFNGISLERAPKHGVISGNIIDQGYFRGPSDQPGDSNGSGILISGFGGSTSPTDYATDIVIIGNIFNSCARAGVYVVYGAKGISIQSNQIFNCGTDFLADGTTVIASSNTSQNVGILIENTSTVTDLTVTNNNIIDERGTPLTNFGIKPTIAPSSTWTTSNNNMLNCRNTYDLLEQTGSTRKFAKAVTFGGGINGFNAGFAAFGTGGTVNLLNVSSGIPVAPVVGTVYYAALIIPVNVTLTGMAFSIGAGSTGTDKVVGALYNADGTVIATSALAGTTVGSANSKQQLPFIAPVGVVGPGVYFLGLQFNGIAARFLAFNTNIEGFVTGSSVGTFGVIPAITPATTYSVNTGPFASTY